MPEASAPQDPSPRRRHWWLYLLGVVLLALIMLGIAGWPPGSPIHRSLGWTGILILGGSNSAGSQGCPVAAVDSSGTRHQGTPVTEGDGVQWTRFDLEPGRYTLDGINVPGDAREQMVIPGTHVVIGVTNLVGCVSNQLR